MDLDAIKRTLADLEKRVTKLEASGEQVARRIRDESSALASAILDLQRRQTVPMQPRESQWCECGRDGCRWPYCKARENACGNDPLGR